MLSLQVRRMSTKKGGDQSRCVACEFDDNVVWDFLFWKGNSFSSMRAGTSLIDRPMLQTPKVRENTTINQHANEIPLFFGLSF